MWFKEKESSNYEEITKNNPAEIDFLELRMEYTRSSYYNPYGDRNEINELSQLFGEEKFQEIILKIPSLLVSSFVDIDFHMIAFSAAEHLKDEKLLSFHGFIIKKLVESILNSGDGNTPETAYIVINTYEEYALLKLFGLKMIEQKLMKINDRSYDLLEVVDKEGNQKGVYFDIEIPFNWLGSRMNKKKD
jgi:hypothetical protein